MESCLNYWRPLSVPWYVFPTSQVIVYSLYYLKHMIYYSLLIELKSYINFGEVCDLFPVACWELLLIFVPDLETMLWALCYTLCFSNAQYSPFHWCCADCTPGIKVNMQEFNGWLLKWTLWGKERRPLGWGRGSLILRFQQGLSSPCTGLGS